MTKPNVIIVTPHDLGDFLGCYGHPVPTPHLDAVVAEGVIFENHFSTGTVCSPSRGSITTGCYPHTHGLMGLVHRGWALDVEACPPLARILLDAGYETHLFGFQHEHYDPSCLGYEHVCPVEGMNVEQVVPRLTHWLRSRGASGEKTAGQSFLASVGFFDVHRIGARPSGFTRDAYRSADPADVKVPPWLPDLPLVRQELADFYGDVGHMDRWVGEITRALDETGLAGSTVLIFTSDHGASFLHGKATVYDGGTKVPWLMRWPQGIPANTRVPFLTSHVDILPTLLELLGLPVPAYVQGQSMAAWARGEKGVEQPFVFAEKNYTNYYDPTRMVRSQRYKYVCKGLRTCIFDFLIPEIEGSPVQFRMPEVFGFYSARRCTEELYDLEHDPGELDNLAEDAAHRGTLDELRAALDAHLVSTEDPFRGIQNGLMMPEDQYSPVMEAVYRRAASRVKQ